jgi:hypothetical protein
MWSSGENSSGFNYMQNLLCTPFRDLVPPICGMNYSYIIYIFEKYLISSCHLKMLKKDELLIFMHKSENVTVIGKNTPDCYWFEINLFRFIVMWKNSFSIAKVCGCIITITRVIWGYISTQDNNKSGPDTRLGEMGPVEWVIHNSSLIYLHVM